MEKLVSCDQALAKQNTTGPDGRFAHTAKHTYRDTCLRMAYMSGEDRSI
jgi:hypothetical protein